MREKETGFSDAQWSGIMYKDLKTDYVYQKQTHNQTKFSSITKKTNLKDKAAPFATSDNHSATPSI